MKNDQPKKVYYIVAIIVALMMFVGSVVLLSAKNNKVTLFGEMGREYLGRLAFISGWDVQQTPPADSPETTPKTDVDATSGETSAHADTTLAQTTAVETTAVIETTTVPETEAATEPATETTTETVGETTTETDEETVLDAEDYEEPPFVRTEPAIAGRIDEYAQSWSERVDDSFFDDALFIGDSRTQAIDYSGLFPNSTFFAYRGLNTITAMKSPFVNEYDEDFMLVDALANHPEFTKIYICFGINDFWFLESAFREKYSILIDAIKEAAPQAEIYMYSTVPVLDGMQKAESGLNNAKMLRLNQIAVEVAKAKGVKFVDVSEAFIQEDGFRYLTEDQSVDGIHLYYYEIVKVSEYLRTHT